MNKTYIKRQLILNDLGIPMNEEVQEYINYFNELVGNPKYLRKEYVERLGGKGYLYLKGGNNLKLLFYDIENREFRISYFDVWKKFEDKFKFRTEDELDNLFIVILEYFFKHKIDTVWSAYISQ